MAYSRTHYGTGYYIYRPVRARHAAVAALSKAGTKTPPDQDVLDLISSAGTDIAPTTGAQGGEAGS